jgi:uncharacterized NAD(P)/FAD-binding protein YdhS
LLERCREHLVKAGAPRGIKLRQNYNREAPRLTVQIGRYAHAKQYKRMRKTLRTLRSRVGRVMRDVQRQVERASDSGRVTFRRNRAGHFRRNGATGNEQFEGSNGDQGCLILPPFASSVLGVSTPGFSPR